MNSNSTLPSDSPEVAINTVAKRGGGPQTPEGRARCSMNSLKHGKYAKLAPVLKSEDPAAFHDHFKSYAERFQPADPIEHQLIAELASVDWRLNRILAVETRSVDLQVRLQCATTEFERYHLSQIAAAIRKLTDDSQLLDSLSKKEQTLIRNRQTILETLFRIREKQPRQERTAIPNPDNYIDPEAVSKTDSSSGGADSGADSSGLPQEPSL